ncbi:DUF2071 domain-containing protein [Virgibacillus halophilus]|uniref:DUF2071 domain-containing protein n=1 Tax=Tigheibacillus halophilus TaxID=361280 RepID=A0ABU5C6W2_9BACI|nr:DUF2071 domain-containing protein [Virgibacillus halophilus]
MEGNLKLHYQPVSQSYTPLAGSLEHWLLERYCFFTVRKKKIYRGDIHHTPWRIKQAKVFIESFPSHLNDAAVQSPVFHYSHKKAGLHVDAY